MEYKILKDHDVFVKGDVLTDNNDGSFGLERTERTRDHAYTCTITVSSKYVDELVQIGVIESPELSAHSKLQTKFTFYTEFLNTMRSTYEQDKLDVTERYTDGDVSVNEFNQATTVYDNLIKFIDSSLKYLA